MGIFFSISWFTRRMPGGPRDAKKKFPNSPIYILKKKKSSNLRFHEGKLVSDYFEVVRGFQLASGFDGVPSCSCIARGVRGTMWGFAAFAGACGFLFAAAAARAKHGHAHRTPKRPWLTVIAGPQHAGLCRSAISRRVRLLLMRMRPRSRLRPLL